MRTALRSGSTARGVTEISSTPSARKVSVSVRSAPQLAADAHPDAVFVGVLGHELDQAQHREVVRVIEAAKVVVLAVAGQRVLRQVVVPMLKKSTSLARRSLQMAAAGVSIIMPICTSSL